MDAIEAGCPGALLWKINDRLTGGRPDLEVAWRGHTSKIEFKLLKKDENIHQKWEDERQLVTCVKYERQTHHCWIVAYRMAAFERPNTTLIYRPTKLLDRAIPEPTFRHKREFVQTDCLHLWDHGVLEFEGFAHGAIVRLLHFTHQ
jgi:hypothetical protein